MLCKYTGVVHVVVQVLRAPVYPGCGMHICGLVRHGCVERGAGFYTGSAKVQTSASPQFVFGLYSVCIRFVFGLYSVCIRFVFPVQNKGWHVLYTYIHSVYTSTYTAASGYSVYLL